MARGRDSETDGDALHDVIRVAGARGSVGSRLTAGGAWGLWLEDAPWAALHIVLSGTVWLEIDGEPPRRVVVGDVVWLPRHLAHGLAGRPGLPMGPCDRAEAERARQAGRTMHLGQHPAQVRLLTLHYQQDPEVAAHITTALTNPIQLNTTRHPAFAAVTQLLEGELAHPRLGTTAALNSLLDLVLVELIRASTRVEAAVQTGTALHAPLDPVTRDAVSLLHRELLREWTTTSIARSIGVSRATLARRFHRSLGQTPVGYLAACRMDLAAMRLRDTEEPVNSVARAVGYSSPHAFSRAFRRIRGVSPREYRTTMKALDRPGDPRAT